MLKQYLCFLGIALLIGVIVALSISLFVNFNRGSYTNCVVSMCFIAFNAYWLDFLGKLSKEEERKHHG
jgi:hypothetical protein